MQEMGVIKKDLNSNDQQLNQYQPHKQSPFTSTIEYKNDHVIWHSQSRS